MLMTSRNGEWSGSNLFTSLTQLSNEFVWCTGRKVCRVLLIASKVSHVLPRKVFLGERRDS